MSEREREGGRIEPQGRDNYRDRNEHATFKIGCVADENVYLDPCPLSRRAVPLPERLSPHFTVAEFQRSQAAARNGLTNEMNAAQTEAARALCANVLEPLRAVVGPISVSSGYRSPRVNSLVGGSSTSQHTRGEAADISSNALDTADLFNLIRLLGLPYDQLIEEFGRWVHVSHGRRHRRQAIMARRLRGQTKYMAAGRAVLTDEIKAVVRAFQQRTGLAADGVPGPQTLAMAQAVSASGTP